MLIDKHRKTAALKLIQNLAVYDENALNRHSRFNSSLKFKIPKPKNAFGPCAASVDLR